jgi:hypothetical protein
MAFDLKDYVDVAERLAEFYKGHPDGRITTEVLENNDKRVTVRAEVFRTTLDTAPAGVGHSALTIPGSTPYTRGAELENAETSAVGRALVMAGLQSKRIASADEVAAKRTPTKAADIGTPPSSASDDVLYQAAQAIFADDLVEAPKPSLKDEFGLASALAADATCPVHKAAWTFKEGTAKATGRPYAFWACNAKDESGFCKAKPKASWVALQGGR